MGRATKDTPPVGVTNGPLCENSTVDGPRAWGFIETPDPLSPNSPRLCPVVNLCPSAWQFPSRSEGPFYSGRSFFFVPLPLENHTAVGLTPQPPCCPFSGLRFASERWFFDSNVTLEGSVRFSCALPPSRGFRLCSVYLDFSSERPRPALARFWGCLFFLCSNAPLSPRLGVLIGRSGSHSPHLTVVSSPLSPFCPLSPHHIALLPFLPPRRRNRKKPPLARSLSEGTHVAGPASAQIQVWVLDL